MGHTHHHPNGAEQHGAAKHEAGTKTSKLEVQERIRLRAYALSQAGGGGSDLEHWLQAEREIASAHEEKF